MTGDNLLRLLERRLDNVVYRLVLLLPGLSPADRPSWSFYGQWQESQYSILSGSCR